jgi:hypothetical protein
VDICGSVSLAWDGDTDVSPNSDLTLTGSVAEKYSTLSSGEAISESRSKLGSSFTAAVTSHLKEKFVNTTNK